MMDGDKPHECCCGGKGHGHETEECECKAVKMDAELKELLDAQMNHEFLAASAYRALSIWCAAHDFDGFASFFKSQAEEEIEHAEKLMEHLLDLGEFPVLSGQAKPICCFGSLLDTAKMALELEELNTKGIIGVYEKAVAVKAYPTKILMEWFIDEQVEEEAWANKMVTLVERASCAGALYSLDRHIVKDLGD